jgi:hypothetical protein
MDLLNIYGMMLSGELQTVENSKENPKKESLDDFLPDKLFKENKEDIKIPRDLKDFENPILGEKSKNPGNILPILTLTGELTSIFNEQIIQNESFFTNLQRNKPSEALETNPVGITSQIPDKGKNEITNITNNTKMGDSIVEEKNFYFQLTLNESSENSSNSIQQFLNNSKDIFTKPETSVDERGRVESPQIELSKLLNNEKISNFRVEDNKFEGSSYDKSLIDNFTLTSDVNNFLSKYSEKFMITDSGLLNKLSILSNPDNLVIKTGSSMMNTSITNSDDLKLSFLNYENFYDQLKRETSTEKLPSIDGETGKLEIKNINSFVELAKEAIDSKEKYNLIATDFLGKLDSNENREQNTSTNNLVSNLLSTINPLSISLNEDRQQNLSTNNLVSNLLDTKNQANSLLNIDQSQFPVKYEINNLGSNLLNTITSLGISLNQDRQQNSSTNNLVSNLLSKINPLSISLNEDRQQNLSTNNLVSNLLDTKNQANSLLNLDQSQFPVIYGTNNLVSNLLSTINTPSTNSNEIEEQNLSSILENIKGLSQNLLTQNNRNLPSNLLNTTNPLTNLTLDIKSDRFTDTNKIKTLDVVDLQGNLGQNSYSSDVLNIVGESENLSVSNLVSDLSSLQYNKNNNITDIKSLESNYVYPYLLKNIYPNFSTQTSFSTNNFSKNETSMPKQTYMNELKTNQMSAEPIAILNNNTPDRIPQLAREVFIPQTAKNSDNINQQPTTPPSPTIESPPNRQANSEQVTMPPITETKSEEPDMSAQMLGGLSSQISALTSVVREISAKLSYLDEDTNLSFK